MSESALRERMCDLGLSIFERGLTAGSSGNLSARLRDGGLLLTPTGSCLGELDPARLSRLDAAGKHVSGDPPSKEAFLHRGLYGARPQAGAVVHLHSTHAVAVSCLRGLDAADCIPPLTPYFVMKVGRLPLVPYLRPGDPALGEAVGALAAGHTAVLLANHGPVVSGPDLESACYAAEELEETARLFLLLRGHDFRPLDAAQLAALRAAFQLDP
ncbi:MAG: aldolase [Deltaproteobacteria bacterium]|nr:aldolase [Deltaproteobacteria bacterium]